MNEKNEIDDLNTEASNVPDFQISLNRAKIREKQLDEFVKEIMIEGIDYGYIDGYAKPTLLKPGAEKLTDIYGFSKKVEVSFRMEEWETGLFHYEVKALLQNKKSGQVEAEGIGSCNSRENKFKNSDPYSIVNTILKIAKKRAVVDAVLSATRTSGIFMQDVEDFEVKTNDENDDKTLNSTVIRIKRKATKKQLELIYELVNKKNIDINEIKKTIFSKYGVNESKELEASDASDFIKHLMNSKEKT